VGQLADRLGRDARLAFGVGEGVALDLGRVGLEIEGRPADELRGGKAGVDDLAADGVGQGDVAADVEPQPDVCPFGRARPARIDRVEPGAVADAAQEVMEEDRMRLPGIAAPEDDQVRLLGLTV
jgi:hypothetical protein